MEKPRGQLIGQDGNAFAIIAACCKAAHKAGWTPEQWTAVKKQMMSGNYENLLAMACEFFDVR